MTSFLRPKAGVLVRLVARNRNARRRVRTLNQDLTILGAGDGSDVILASSRIARVQTALVKRAGGLWVRDLGGGATTLNGEPVKWAAVRGGDRLGIGPFLFGVELGPASEPASEPNPDFRLRNDRVIGTVGAVESILLVGRDPACDVVLSGQRVQPRHCLVVWTQDGPVLRDLSGCNLTRMNGRRIRFGRLMNGDAIGVGPYELLFEVDEARAAPAATREAASVGLMGDAGLSEMVAGRFPHHFPRRIEELWPDLEEGVRHAERETAAPLPLTDESPDAPAPAAATGRDAGSGARRATAKTGPRRARSTPKESISLGTRGLARKAEALRARVIAAQKALDERAEKQRAALAAERRELERRRAELRCRARDGSSAPEAETRDAARPGGHAFEGAAAGADAPGAPVDSAGDGAAGGHDVEGLEARVAELVRLADAERKAIDRSESALEALRFEAEQQRCQWLRRRTGLSEREAALEAGFKTLAESLEALHRERAPLLARLRAIDREEGEIRTRIREGERTRRALASEAESLERVGEELARRRRELMEKLEEERRRLRARQDELRRRATKLERAARVRRMQVEAEVSRRTAEIEAREAELRARRAALENSARGELQRTAAELEQVLNVRLSEIEKELTARQAELDARVAELRDAPEAAAGTPPPTRSIEEPIRRMADELTAIGREGSLPPTAGTRLDELEARIEALAGEDHEAVSKPDATPPGTSTEPPGGNGRDPAGGGDARTAERP